MLLSVAERINLLQLLPREGGFITMKIVRALGEALDFDDAEKELIGLVEVDVEGGKNLRWDPKTKDQEFENIKGETVKVVADVLKKLDEEGKLTPAMVTLYQKFVVDPMTK